MPSTRIRILHVEDVPADAELAERELRQAGFEFEIRRVETREAFLAALADFAPDLILSDYRLPEFDGMQALLLAKEHAPDVPVVITTGSVNEQTAVECMKAGAADYVLKEQLGHLGTAVRSALERQRLLVERRRARRALRESEERYRALFDGMLNGFAYSELLYEDGRPVDYRYLVVNPAFGKLTGLTDVVGRTISEIVPGILETNPELIECYGRVVGTGSAETFEIFIPALKSWFSVLAYRVQGSYFVAVFDNVTERKKAEAALLVTQQQLAQAQKMEAIGRLAGGVAHDFNNLLTVIQGYGEILAESVEGDADKRESVGEIVKAAKRASALTRQLLAFSRRQVLEPKVLDVGAVVADIEQMLKRLIGEDIEVVVVKPAALGRVKADPGQVEQVVLNVAVNARDAMPAGGRLTLALADASLDAPVAAFPDVIPPGRYVEFSMTDTGCGMDAETLSHAFEPFFTTKERGKGTGLGLATVYGIVRQSGGHVAMESAPGKGTTLRIYLPWCDEPLDSAQPSTVRSLRGTETVLVVEDEASVRSIAQAVLRKRGYTVLVAEDGGAALELLARDPRPVHVLLTDVVMPGMNGRELAARVAEIRPSVRTILMSGYAADVLTRVEAADVAGFLPKPFSDRTLTAKIREVLDAPAA